MDLWPLRAIRDTITIPYFHIKTNVIKGTQSEVRQTPFYRNLGFLVQKSLSQLSKLILYNQRSYLDKQVALSLNKNRKVTGTLRGFDQFMNIVLGDALEEIKTEGGGKAENNIGMVVIRGNSILQFELVGK